MIKFVEYDENGDIFHIAEIHTAEGPEAPPAIMEPLEEPSDPTERSQLRAERQTKRAERKARIDSLIQEREAATLAELTTEASKPNRRLLILSKNAALPDIEKHKVENGAIRVRTQAERDARLADREARRNQPVPSL